MSHAGWGDWRTAHPKWDPQHPFAWRPAIAVTHPPEAPATPVVSSSAAPPEPESAVRQLLGLREPIEFQAARASQLEWRPASVARIAALGENAAESVVLLIAPQRRVGFHLDRQQRGGRTQYRVYTQVAWPGADSSGEAACWPDEPTAEEVANAQQARRRTEYFARLEADALGGQMREVLSLESALTAGLRAALLHKVPVKYHVLLAGSIARLAIGVADCSFMAGADTAVSAARISQLDELLQATRGITGGLACSLAERVFRELGAAPGTGDSAAGGGIVAVIQAVRRGHNASAEMTQPTAAPNPHTFINDNLELSRSGRGFEMTVLAPDQSRRDKWWADASLRNVRHHTEPLELPGLAADAERECALLLAQISPFIRLDTSPGATIRSVRAELVRLPEPDWAIVAELLADLVAGWVKALALVPDAGKPQYARQIANVLGVIRGSRLEFGGAYFGNPNRFPRNWGEAAVALQQQARERIGQRSQELREVANCQRQQRNNWEQAETDLARRR